MVPEGGAPTLAPIFNANPCMVEKKTPNIFIGSTEINSQRQLIYDDTTDSLIEKDIQFVPGFLKIFDEIWDPTMSKIKVTIDPKQNLISVYNNGSGFPVEIHKEEKVYIPELIFGHLFTSSNYVNSEKKLCNIFSTKLIVEIASKESGKKYYQKFINNLSVIEPPKITKLGKGEDKFQMNHLNADIMGLLKRVFLNDSKLKLKNFKDYIKMCLKSTSGPDGKDLTKKLVLAQVSECWEVGFIPSSLGQLQQVSFVNSISTSKGGTHVNYMVDAIVELIQEALSKKKLKSEILPGVIKSNMCIFVNCLIDNLSFNSQTKEYMTLKPASFGSRCELTEKFQVRVLKLGVINMLITLSQAKDNVAMVEVLDSTMSGLISKFPKPADANKSGTIEEEKCTLILTEGDSASSLIMEGLNNLGRDYYGIFPLCGKLLNVRNSSPAQVGHNKILNSIRQIMGLNSLVDNSDISKLRYGHVMMMMDQDLDGSHINGLLINFFDVFYPSFLNLDGFLQEFITPVVRANPKDKDGVPILFFTIAEYEQWCATSNFDTNLYNINYREGFSTLSREESEEYFSNFTHHVIYFQPMQDDERQFIDLAFNKKKGAACKEWLSL
ncbi:DNA topoisomerase 2, partial [Massospora cicadina]